MLMQWCRFRWTACQLEVLKRSLPSTIRCVLGDLPRSLDETYDRILSGITQERRKYAQRLFQCISVSIRPLRVEELAEILAIQFNEAALPAYDADWRPENAEEDVLSVCSSLISIVNADRSRVVQFSHFSVQEYLSSKRLAANANLSQFYILPHSAHTILAQASLGVLLALDYKPDKDMMKNFPLATYAAHYWVDHAQYENVSSRIKDTMGRLFDAAKPHFATWVWIYDIDDPFREMIATRPAPPQAVPLYYAALCGFRDLVEHLINTSPKDVNARGGYHCTPLHVAIAKRNIDVTKLLLAHGADVTALGNKRRTPLHETSRRGCLEMTKLLLGRDVDVNAQDDDGITPLYMASHEGELEVARELLQRGASTAAGRNKPLHIASLNGHPDVVRLLLQSGTAVDPRRKDGRTPLVIASHNGHSHVVRLLLQYGAAVDSRDKKGWTSLHAASQDGHLDVVHLLLHGGANIHSRNKDGRTPLHIASQMGRPDAVRLLLQSGAAVNTGNNDGLTPLLLSSLTGHPDVVRLLLLGGATVDSRHKDGWTPLHASSQAGHLDVVKLLLQNGAAVASCRNNGWTPLHQAAMGGHLDVVRLLLRSGATVASQDDHSSTAPSGTSRYSC
jgi:ankyrin repeat protein